MKKFFIFLMSILLISCNGQENKVSKKKNLKMENKNLEYATFGGGCFWCVEACFDMLKGVESVTSGYSGGHKENPTYEEVCTGETGHAEVVQIAFDPSVISFSQLLESFWFLHDPTPFSISKHASTHQKQPPPNVAYSRFLFSILRFFFFETLFSCPLQEISKILIKNIKNFFI
jgi:peptide-methionine (S)-S-oxide reductase